MRSPYRRALQGLIDALRRLPGVGVKSAQRMAFHLLQHDREGARRLAGRAAGRGRSACATASAATPSPKTRSAPPASTRARRAPACVVETPADQAALERTGSYRGLYFVLMGRLSPLDGVGARDIGAGAACSSAPATASVEEVILATSFTAEGEATAHVLAQALRRAACEVTRLARGVPVGSELEYVDLSTIAHALGDRR